MRTLLATLLFCAAVQAHATTYFIDFATGSDANAGTSKAAPWKRHPYMAGFAGGPYFHVSGDRFVFKGGVTWPVTCFQMLVSVGGSSTAVRDYYGSDQTWFVGAAWARPLFDFGHTFVGAGDTAIFVNGASFVTWDGLEMANFRSPAGVFGRLTMRIDNGADSVTLTNCVVRDWDFDSIGAGLDNTAGGIGVLVGGGNTANRVTHCTFTQSGVAMRCGVAVANLPLADNCEFYQVSNAFVGGASAGIVVHDCQFHDMPAPSDPLAHGNAVQTFYPTTVYNCTLQNLNGTVSPIALVPDFVTPGLASSNYVYNCVMDNTGGQTPISFQSGGNPSNGKFYVWNNTVSDNGWIVRTAGVGTFGYVELRNNHFITPQNPAWMFTPPNGAPVTTLVTDHNLTQTPTQAAINGYLAAGGFQPTAVNSPTVDVGADLSANFTTDVLGVTRPKLVAWDIGAYEFQPVTPPTTLALSAGSYSTSIGAGSVTITINRTGSTTGTSTVAYATANGSAVAGTDYTATSGTLTFTAGQTSRTFSVTIINTGAFGPPRNFMVVLSNPTGANLGLSASAVSITQGAVTSAVLTIGGNAVWKGNVTIGVKP